MSDGLTVVIPALDEEACLASVVAEVVAVGERLPGAFEVVIVDDGSTDRTPRIAEQLAQSDPRIRWLRHPRNRGSGMAIRSGIAAAREALVTYVPADGQVDVKELVRYVAAAEGADIVVGVRDSRADYTLYRKAQSQVFLALANALFGLGLRDVNWVHLWRRSVIDDLELRSEGVFFLVEALVLARQHGARIVEIESAYRPRRGGRASGARPATALRTLAELVALRARV